MDEVRASLGINQLKRISKINLSKKKSFLLTKKILIKYLIYLQNYTQNQIQNIRLKKKFPLALKLKLWKKNITFINLIIIG